MWVDKNVDELKEEVIRGLSVENDGDIKQAQSVDNECVKARGKLLKMTRRSEVGQARLHAMANNLVGRTKNWHKSETDEK